MTNDLVLIEASIEGPAGAVILLNGDEIQKVPANQIGRR